MSSRENPAPSSQTFGPPTFAKASINRWILGIVILGIVVVAVLFTLLYQSTAVVSSKGFSYTEPAGGGGSNGKYTTLLVSNVNGGIKLLPWAQNTFVINGTVTAKGIGSSPEQVNLVESNTNGSIIFRALFPNTIGFFASQSYTAIVNVYFPMSITVGKLVVNTVNGIVQAANLNVTGASLSSVSGDVSFSCSYCGAGGISASTTNGIVGATFSAPLRNGTYTFSSMNGNVHLTVPSVSSFSLTATYVNGGFQTSGLTLSNQVNTNGHFSAIVGSGTAIVTINTVNGQIIVTGT